MDSENMLKEKQDLLQEFRAIQAQLAEFIRKLHRSSSYAGQSAAFLRLERWNAKSDRVLQALQELKL